MKSRIALAMRIALGALFTYAGIAKLSAISSFAGQLAIFSVPGWAVAAVAYFLPAIEIVCGVCLLSGLCTRGALLTTVVMLVGFEIVLGIAWARGVEADCGCFGRLFGTTSIPAAFLRNIALCGALGLVIWHQWKRDLRSA